MMPEETHSQDWRQIAIYWDGSGLAGDRYDCAVRTIQERRDVLALKETFIEKHCATLAGLNWRVGYLEPEIEVSGSYYRGEQVTAKAVAQLWPEAKWRRVKQPYGEPGTFDWCAVVDGLTIRIEGAECEPRRPPPPKLKEGPIDLD